MKSLYFDNSATSFPKAPNLGKIMGEHIDGRGYNVNRGNYSPAYSLESTIIDTREKLHILFNSPNKRNIVFVPGATAGINMVLTGLLTEGDQVITSSMEHNAIGRPMNFLKDTGINWAIAQCDEDGSLTVDRVKSLITAKTKLIILTHCSNVCGTLLPIEEIGNMCREHDVLFAVDAAQSAGILNIDMISSKIDCLILPGHKGLLGPQGIGAVLMSDQMANQLAPSILGGTGSKSDQLYMPTMLPDKFEAGTPNIPGIVGLGHALDYISKVGIDSIYEREMSLTKLFLDGIRSVENVAVAGKKTLENRLAVVSISFANIDNAEASFLLEDGYDILTRCGLHCAPLAHQTLKTYPSGTVRFSFGHFNRESEILAAISAIEDISKL